MARIVRLQGLPPNADSSHIKNFFSELRIPPYGVVIIGGVNGEAFVRFKKVSCVPLALKMSGQLLMGFPVYVSVDNKYKAAFQQHPNRCTHKCIPGYLRITYRPLDAQLYHVKSIFKELSMKSVIKVRNGQALVHFGESRHVQRILGTYQWPQHKREMKRNGKRIVFSVLSVKHSNEKEWISWGGKIKPCPHKNKQKQGSKWLPEMSVNDHDTVCIREFYAHLVNVSLRAEKSHIRKFLFEIVGDSQITFLCDKNGSRLRECFVMFVTENDYIRALELDKAVLKGRRVRVLPISKENMMELIKSKKEVVLEDTALEDKGIEPELKYLYLRNFAACVCKLDVLDFLTGFTLTEKDICLLYNDHGDSLGEALVRFSTKEEASRAEKLNHKRFQDTEILLRRISEEQLKVFGVDCFLDHSTAKQDFCASVSEADDGIY
ncbi:RNA-binding protein 12-like [Hyla sarda]|uniref:RNA-binding protein 12-like n=1 Tax=Hyla sarda TaxID=327740 RepID=UPI0024C2FFEA|nr:RNA-binding protein 12-like [Hyla sarda]XP_056378302.1 RNA-binding protein 12-like [Hyla sarda]